MIELITLDMDDLICGVWYHVYLEGITFKELLFMQSGTDEEYMAALIAEGAKVTPLS